MSGRGFLETYKRMDPMKRMRKQKDNKIDLQIRKSRNKELNPNSFEIPKACIILNVPDDEQTADNETEQK